MPAAESILKKYWTYLLAATTVCVWLIRLEGKVDYIEKIQDTEGKRMATAIEKMAATQDRMSEQISEMRSALSGVVGYEKGAHDAIVGTSELASSVGQGYGRSFVVGEL